MPSRLMRYTPGTLTTLEQNTSHQFAANYAVSLYARKTVFTFIPKNGCTTLRYTAALENQVIGGPDEIAWVHRNNGSFRPTHGELVTASYTFVVLRCPFQRLVSCFLHKIVEQPSMVQPLQALAFANPGPDPDLGKPPFAVAPQSTAVDPELLDAITFADFVALLERPGALEHDIRWRPQVDFLVYKTYDDVFRLEDMESLASTVQAKSGLVVQDARDLTGHGNHARARINDGFFGRTDVRTLRGLKTAMQVPAYARLYDADLYQRVSRLYQADLDLYTSHFGQAALMQLQ